MDIASLSNALKQFLDIAESTSLSQSDVSKKSDNQPDTELVAEFERYMQEPSQPEKLENIKQTDETFSVQNQDSIFYADRIEQVGSSQEINLTVIDEKTKTHGIPDSTAKDINAVSADRIAVEPQEYLQEIQDIFRHIESSNISSSELYRLQYLTSMLNVRISQNNSMQQSSTQQFETILKQQG